METTALRHGKKIIAKLEERVRGLEDELGKCEDNLNFIFEQVLTGVRGLKHSSFKMAPKASNRNVLSF